MKPYLFSGLLILLTCVLLSIYSLATWSQRFVQPAAAAVEAHTRYLAHGKSSERPNPRALISLMEPRTVQLDTRG